MDLLEYFASVLDCSYLSDLNYLTITQEQAGRLRGASEMEYSLQDYNEAASYILRRQAQFDNIQAAKDAIIAEMIR